MPILTLQRRQVEVGRIRIGELVAATKRNGEPTKRPSKRSSFLFTTESRALADQVATQFAGTVAEWTPNGGTARQWKVDTSTKALAVIVPPNSISQWYELWTGGACVRRCDGERNVLTDKPCACPVDPADRSALAADGKACKPTTRLNVMLADLPGIGVWRVETHGFYAATELPAVAELLAAAGGYIPGRLELQQRSARRPKTRGDGYETRTWMVPVLHVDATPTAVLEGRARLAIADGETRPALAAAPAANPAQPALPAAGRDAGEEEYAQSERDDEMRQATAHERSDHYRLIAEHAKTLADVQQAWRDAKAAGVLTEDLAVYLRQRGDALSKPAEPPVDADADEPNGDQVWVEVVTVAGKLSMDLSAVEGAIVQRFGKPSDECNGWQLAEFRDALKNGEIPSGDVA